MEKQPYKQPGLVTRAKPATVRAVEGFGARDYFRLDRGDRFLEEVAFVFSLEGRKRKRLSRKGDGHQRLGKQLGQMNRRLPRLPISASAFLF